MPTHSFCCSYSLGQNTGFFISMRRDFVQRGISKTTCDVVAIFSLSLSASYLEACTTLADRSLTAIQSVACTHLPVPRLTNTRYSLGGMLHLIVVPSILSGFWKCPVHSMTSSVSPAMGPPSQNPRSLIALLGGYSKDCTLLLEEAS